MKRLILKISMIIVMLSTTLSVSAASGAATIAVNVLLNKDADVQVVKQLAKVGTVLNILSEIDAIVCFTILGIIISAFNVQI